jgi:hypothetical protein
MSNINIGPLGAELFHEDGRTDKTKLIVAFRNFANAFKDAIQTCTRTVASSYYTYGSTRQICSKMLIRHV